MNFCVNQMSSKGARAASVLSTQSCFFSFEKWYRLLNGLDGIKGSILVYTNHINYEICIEHCFLAPWVYLCSTSLNKFLKNLLCKLTKVYNLSITYILVSINTQRNIDALCNIWWFRILTWQVSKKPIYKWVPSKDMCCDVWQRDSRMHLVYILSVFLFSETNVRTLYNKSILPSWVAQGFPEVEATKSHELKCHFHPRFVVPCDRAVPAWAWVKVDHCLTPSELWLDLKVQKVIPD